jgi:hypothetical protein
LKLKKSYFSIFPLAFVILLTSGNPLSTVSGNLFYYLLVPSSLMLYYRISKKKVLWQKNILTYTFLLFVFLVVSSFIINFNINNFGTNIKFLLVISFSYLFCLLVPFYIFSKYYIRALKVISIISLFGYSILNFTSLNLPLATFKNINDVEYYNGIFFFAIKSFAGGYDNVGIDRNIGTFWEPGLFATLILIAIILELWNKNKTSKLTILIFLITLYTTKSTYGYLMLVPISFELFTKVLNKRFSFSLTIFLITIVVFLNYKLNDFISWLVQINPRLFSKLIDESNSFNARIESPLTNLRIFENNYLFGAGLGNTENLFNNMTIGSQTSTSTYFLAAFGFLGIAYTLLFIYGVLSYKEVNLSSRLVFLFILLTQINKEPHIYFTTTFILLFYFLKESSFVHKQNI